MSSKSENKKSNDLVLILTIHDQIIAEMVKNALENESIPVIIKSVTGFHSRGMLPFEQSFFDYRLYISSVNEVRARELVETIVPSEEIK
jgi:hypothetical protein